MKHKDHTHTEFRRLRRELGITQRALALEIGVPQSTVYRWEKGIVSPNSRNAKAIQEFARSRGADFNLFASPEEIPSPTCPEDSLEEATLRLAQAQTVFCATIEKLRRTDAGSETWGILRGPVQTQRRRLSLLLEAAAGPEQSLGFWRAVSILKVFTWRAGSDPEEEHYVEPHQVAPTR